MGPPSAQTSEQPPSPPVPYQIPAPLMNPDGSVPAMHPPPPFQGGPAYQQRQETSSYDDVNGATNVQQSSDGQQGYSFEANELFAQGGSSGNMPPTPANSSSYNGISSSSTSSLPTVSHPGTSANNNATNGALAMSRHASNGPLTLDNSGYSYSNGQAQQAIGMSPSASHGSHTSHSGTGGFPPMTRHMTESPMHIPL